MNKKTIPFAVLGILHIFLLGFTFYKKKHKTLIQLFNSIGIAYVFEYFVLNLFKMYIYYPKVFKNKWIDNVFGAVLSQALFVPITATFLSLFNLGWKWRVGAALAYGLVERLFIKLKIFKNKTWHTFYTITAMPIYFFIVRRWWECLQNKDSKVIPVISLFFFYWSNYTNIYFFFLSIFRKCLFHIGFVKDKYWEHFILLPLYTFYQSIIAVINSMYFPKKTKVIGLLLLHLSDQLMFRLRIIRPKNGCLYTFIPVHILFLFFGEYFKSLIKNDR